MCTGSAGFPTTEWGRPFCIKGADSVIIAVHAVHFLHVQEEQNHQPPEDDTHIIQEGMVGI